MGLHEGALLQAPRSIMWCRRRGAISYLQTFMNSEELVRRLANFESVEPSGPASEALIATAEQQLGIQFPTQYRSFLATFGCGGVDSEEFIGLGGPDHLNIAKLASRLRDRTNPLPENLLPLRGDGFGNYDCININQSTNCGEYAIVQWNHEEGEPQKLKVIAISFDQWFESVLVMLEQNK